MPMGKLAPVLILPLLIAATSCAQQEHESRHGIFSSSHEGRSGWLGVSIEDMTARTAKRMNVRAEAGALVNNVSEDSPASKAGILEDDIIVEFDGRAIKDAEDLVTAVRKTDPGKKADLVVMRRDKRTTLQVEIGRSPRERDYTFRMGPREGSAFAWSTRTGIEGLGLTDMTRQLAQYFEVPDGRGVLVERVEEGTPAAKAGFAAGDVIISIGKDRVFDTGDIDWALEDRKEGETVSVTVVRKGARKTLALPLSGERSEKILRFKRKMVVPDPHDIEIEIEHPDKPEGMLLHEGSIERATEKLRLKMRELGEKLRDQTARINIKVQRAIRDL